MRLSDSRIALHGRAAVQPATDESFVLSISIPRQRASTSLSFLFSKPVNRKSCFLVTPFFILLFIPKGLVLSVHTIKLITQFNQQHPLSPVDINTKSQKSTTLLISSSCPLNLQQTNNQPDKLQTPNQS
jgi:hypothetical protein